jgi:hypothetical protein
MPKSKDNVVLPKNYYDHCAACIDMEKNGLRAFDEDGTYGEKPGDSIILRLIEVFEKLEMHKECAFLEDLLVQYQAKFYPDLKFSSLKPYAINYQN